MADITGYHKDRYTPANHTVPIDSHDQSQKIPYVDRDDYAPEAVVYAPEAYNPYPTAPAAEHTAASPVAQSGDLEKPPPKKRSRRLLWIVLGVVAVLVIIGAVLGGVLGTQLNKNRAASDSISQIPTSTPNTTSIRVASNSHVATARSADNTGTLLYYQLGNGSLYETLSPDSSFASGNGEYALNRLSIVPVSDIATGSPISATSFVANGTLWKMLVYTTTAADLMQISSQGGRWGSPSRIVQGDGNRLAANTQAIALCAGNDTGLEGARVYYHAASGGLAELKWDWDDHLPDQLWSSGANFADGDREAGIACTYSTFSLGYMAVAYRSTNNSNLLRRYYNRPGNVNGGPWTNVTDRSFYNTQSLTIAKNSSIAMMEVLGSSSSRRLYTFYTGADGDLKMVSATAPTTSISSQYSYSVPASTSLDSFYTGTLPVVLGVRADGTLNALKLDGGGTQQGNATLVASNT